MAEFYKALFEYTTDQQDELSVKEGEILRITNKENADWWIAERLNHSKSFGLVPSNFLEHVQVLVVVKEYEAQDKDELSLHKDEKLIFIGRDNDWTQGELNGKTGIFPSKVTCRRILC
ncbi:SH3 domain-containing protein [Sporodiniella umbellata]|nr:SH3 domain-containing protein [Sporodiniella umbellata]